MKKLFFLLFVSVIGCPVYAAYAYIWAPNHPLAEKQQYIRVLADSIVYKDYDGKNEYVGGGYEVIKRSADGLTETVRVYYGLISDHIYTYSEDGRYISWKELEDIYGQGKYVRAEVLYEYDIKGRLIATYTVDNTIAEPDTLESERCIYLDDLAQYTDSGYIHATVKISIDRYNGEVKEKGDTIVTEYVFDDQKRLIRAGIRTYTYFDDGSVMMTVNQKPYPVYLDRKTEYYNNADGYFIGSKTYVWRNSMWNSYESGEVSYFYNDEPQSSVSVSEPLQKVYGIEGAIVVTAENDVPVCVYTLSGQLIKKVIAQPHESIPMPKGLYVVIMKGRPYKVLVK